MSRTMMIVRAVLADATGRRIGLMLAVVLVGVLAVRCTVAQSDAPVPDPVPTVEVAVADDDLAVQQSVPAGRVVLEIANTGDHPHQVVLVPMDIDWPPIHEELANDVERPMRIRARVGPLEPGETATIAVEVADGQRYALLGSSEAPSGKQYMNLGVASEFTAHATERRPSPASPAG